MASWCCMSPEVFLNGYVNMHEVKESAKVSHLRQLVHCTHSHLPRLSTAGQSGVADDERSLGAT